MRKIGVTNADHVRVATANRSIVLVGLACLLTLCVAMPAPAGQIKTVFVIAFENHNWTQPASQHNPGSILGNRNAPYINSLVQHGNPNATQVSYASNYLNAGPAIHPSEANYIWSEAGSNLGVKTDNDPYAPGGNNQSTADSLSNYLQRSGKIWRSYQEDVNIDVTNNLPVAKTITKSRCAVLQENSRTEQTSTTVATDMPTAQNTILQYFLPRPMAVTTRPPRTRGLKTMHRCSSCRRISRMERWQTTIGSRQICTTICTRRSQPVSPTTAPI